jgi:hypothetical protein
VKELKSINYPSDSCYNLCGSAKTNDQRTTSYDVSYFKNTIAPMFQGPTDNGNATNPNSVHWNALFTSSSSAPVTYRVAASFEVMIYEFNFFSLLIISVVICRHSLQNNHPACRKLQSDILIFSKVAIFLVKWQLQIFLDQTFRKIRFIFQSQP